MSLVVVIITELRFHKHISLIEFYLALHYTIVLLLLDEKHSFRMLVLLTFPHNPLYPWYKLQLGFIITRCDTVRKFLDTASTKLLSIKLHDKEYISLPYKILIPSELKYYFCHIKFIEKWRTYLCMQYLNSWLRTKSFSPSSSYI